MYRPPVAKFIFEHLFLPPKLPQSDHDEHGADELLKQVSTAARALQARSILALRDVFGHILLARLSDGSISTMQELHVATRQPSHSRTCKLMVRTIAATQD